MPLPAVWKMTMKDDLSRIRLDRTLANWPLGNEENRGAIGEGWAIAEEFLRLHTRGLQHISRAAGRTPSVSDKAVILLGAHGLNLYITTLKLIVGGLFDVASHLLRGLLDCQSLLYATAKNEESAAKFMLKPGELKASDARKVMINDLRSAGEDELADDIEARYLQEAKAANSLSHVSVIHADKLVEIKGKSITPIGGGVAAAGEARLLWLATLEQESWTLSWLRAFRASSLDSIWKAEREAVNNRFKEWFLKEAGELNIEKAQRE
jgi:hypothetical protein